MQLEKTMFREYDIRGLVDKQLTEEAAKAIGKAFGTFLLKRKIKDCVIGHDAREYSERLQNAFTAGLISTGINAIDIGLVITPITYFAQVHFKIKGCAMITASHNPNGWSGFKLGYGYAKTLLPEDIKEMCEIIGNEKFTAGGETGKLRKKEILNAYIKDLISKVRIKPENKEKRKSENGAQKNKKIKIVINARNGTASEIAPLLFENAGCEVIKQFCKIDFDFPNGNADPSLDEMLNETGKKVLQENADLGFAFDGDGDRLGIVDEKGNAIYPDKWLILLAKGILRKYPHSKIVFDVKCTKALADEISKNGGIPVMWKTGHSHIKKKAHEIKAALAGERSGHIFFLKGYYGYDDACFAGLKILEFISEENKKLSELIDALPKYYSSPVIHAHCDDKAKYQVVDKLIEIFKKKFPRKVNDINGARIEFEDGFGLVRASSNMPALVLVFEAKSQKRLDEITNLFKEELGKFKEIGKWNIGG